MHQTFSIYGELNQLYFCLKETCEVTDDCSDGLICRNQKCKPCFQSGQCPFGHYCKDGSCKKEEIEDTCDTSLVRLHYSQYFWKWTKTNPMKVIRKSNSLWRNQTWFCVCLYNGIWFPGNLDLALTLVSAFSWDWSWYW